MNNVLTIYIVGMQTKRVLQLMVTQKTVNSVSPCILKEKIINTGGFHRILMIRNRLHLRTINKMESTVSQDLHITTPTRWFKVLYAPM